MQADLDNGYTRIANEILEALARLDLSGREFRVAVAIMRKTYGFQKRVDWISLDQLSEITGIAKENVSRVVTALCLRKIIIKEGDGYTKKLGMNNKLKEWFEPEQIVKNDNGGAAKQQNVENDKLSNPTTDIVVSDNGHVEIDNGDVGFQQPQKKETITKEIFKEMFESLWKPWPKGFGNKGPKDKAEAEFLKIKPDRELFASMIRARDAQGADKAKRKAAGERFIPDFQHIERWLKNKRWTDELDDFTPAPAGSRHNDFDNRDYTAGVASDGTF